MDQSERYIVFFGSNHEAIKNVYFDLMKCERIEYDICPWSYRDGWFSFVLSKKATSLLPPFIIKELYYKIFKWQFLRKSRHENKILFVVCVQFTLYEDYIFIDFIRSLRRIYPNSQFAFYYNDTIGQHGDYEYNLIYALKDTFDLVLTYDKKDSLKYGLEYYGSINSKVPDFNMDLGEYSDFFYAGSDAGRFSEQISLFVLLSDLEYNVVFFLWGVEENEVLKLAERLNGLEFVDEKTYRYKNSKLYINTFCEYGTVISYTNKCKCLVEIIKKENSGSSLRLSESVMYEKKLLTNCKDTINYPYYRKSNILIFDDVSNLSSNVLDGFLSDPFEPVKNTFSPLALVEHIAHIL